MRDRFAFFGAVTTKPAVFASVWTNAGGTNPSLGDGTFDMHYCRVGVLCHINFRMVMGTTTTYGNAATGWQLSLPFAQNALFAARGLMSLITDVSALVDYNVQGQIGGGSSQLIFQRAGSSIRLDAPMVWAAGDLFQGSFVYVTA